MASDLKHFLKYSDGDSNANSSQQQRVTIFTILNQKHTSPNEDLFSPEEDTNDYLEDYLEYLGEYHVQSEFETSSTNRNLQQGICRNKQFICEINKKEENANITKVNEKQDKKCVSNGGKIEDKKENDNVNRLTIQKDINKHSANKPIKRSFELKELKSDHTNRDRKGLVNNPPAQTATTTFRAKSKEIQKTLNVTQTLNPQKVRVKSPKILVKQANVQNTNYLQLENSKLPQDESINIGKGHKETNSELIEGASPHHNTQYSAAKLLKSKALSTEHYCSHTSLSAAEASKKKSPRKTSPRPNRPTAKNTVNKFFEAFM